MSACQQVRPSYEQSLWSLSYLETHQTTPNDSEQSSHPLQHAHIQDVGVTLLQLLAHLIHAVARLQGSNTRTTMPGKPSEGESGIRMPKWLTSRKLQATSCAQQFAATWNPQAHRLQLLKDDQDRRVLSSADRAPFFLRDLKMPNMSHAAPLCHPPQLKLLHYVPPVPRACALEEPDAASSCASWGLTKVPRRAEARIVNRSAWSAQGDRSNPCVKPEGPMSGVYGMRGHIQENSLTRRPTADSEYDKNGWLLIRPVLAGPYMKASTYILR